MAFGIIEYDIDGLPKCEICGRYFNRVLPHVRQKHNMDETTYKKKFGFDHKKGICSIVSSMKSRVKTLENYTVCISNNLKKSGMETRFIKGSKGRTKDKVSEQTKIRLKENLKTPNVIAAMKKSGEQVGKSGLGNKKRWKK